jgi:hypothetical protein
VPSAIRWSLVNSITIVLPQTTASLPVGCHVRYLRVPTSHHVASGIYQLQEEVIYEPWPWRDFVYVKQSPPFVFLPAVVMK